MKYLAITFSFISIILAANVLDAQEIDSAYSIVRKIYLLKRRGGTICHAMRLQADFSFQERGWFKWST